MSKIIDCNQLINCGNEIVRMCNVCDDCSECPLKDLGRGNCIDITRLDQNAINLVQEWSDTHPDGFEVGDKVRVKEHGDVYPAFYKFIIEYGTDEEKAFWQYEKFPSKKYTYTISSINEHPRGGIMVAIITRKLDRDNELMEVYMVGLEGLEKIKIS